MVYNFVDLVNNLTGSDIMEIDFKSFYMMFRKQWKDLNAKINQKLEEVGLSSQHVSYLITLSDNKDIKVKELNSLVGNDKALTTRVLTTLINNEFVAKTEENTRKCKLYLTKKGEEVITSLEKIFKSISNKFTKEDVFGLTNNKINYNQ